jgi:polyisoprenoid-binding protein YceI
MDRAVAACACVALLAAAAAMPAPAMQPVVPGAVPSTDHQTATWEVDKAGSVFALLTRKGGFAKGRAHDHLIVARRFEATLRWTGEPAAAGFSLSLQAVDLDPDPEDPRRQLAPRLVELGAFAGELAPISQEQRARIRESMLGKEQLDAEHFPEIRVELVEVREEASSLGSVETTHHGVIAFTAHGRTVELPFQARLEQTVERLTVEAVASLRFTQIGIEPYSAFLGAVKNLDETILYLRLRATRSDPGGAAGEAGPG